MTALQQRVRRTILRHGLCPPGTRLLVGLSGGSDSVALARLLLDLGEHGGFAVAALAHLNHKLRPTAGRDERFCRDLAEGLGLPIVVEAIEVRAYAAEARVSLEDAARRLRYDFLQRAARQVGADRIAVGHTEDDQAETFLMKLARGAGLNGLSGIHPRRGTIVRPLIDASRAELRGYLSARGLSWVEDETNADCDNPRNRIRHRVIPELDLTCGGSARSAIARAAALVREDGAWLDELGRGRFEALVRRVPDGLEADPALAHEPIPIRRRVLLEAMRVLAGERQVGLEHVEAALAVLAGRASAADIPGSRVELRRGRLVLLEQGPRTK
jgi:tRNA(Ile)-lysidine synthase